MQRRQGLARHTRRLHGNETNSRQRWRHGFRCHHSSAIGSCSPAQGETFFFFPFFFSSSSKLDPVSTLTCVRSICVPKRHTPLECLHGAHNLIRLIMDAAAEGGGRVRCVRSGGCYLLLFSFFSPLFFSCNFLKDIFFFLLVGCIPKAPSPPCVCCCFFCGAKFHFATQKVKLSCMPRR